MSDRPTSTDPVCGGNEAEVVIATTTHPLVIAVISGPSAGLTLGLIDAATSADLGVRIPVDAETVVAIRSATPTVPG